MKTYQGFSQARSKIPPCVYAIGNFDGVHLGHLSLLKRAKEIAEKYKVKFGVYTFWPHPQSVLNPKATPALICTREKKMALLEQSGVEYVVEESFTRDFSRFSAREFANEILLGALDAKGIVTGENFRFGYKARGKPRILGEWLEPKGVVCDVLSPVSVDGVICSSSQIRDYVTQGKITAANRLLGRSFSLTGKVEKGAGRGKKVGIPTANLGGISTIVPSSGVYATKIKIEDDSKSYIAATNVGTRPTFDGDNEIHVESHILDFSQNIYQKKAEVFFFDKIREERKFSSVRELILQIQQDIKVVKSSTGIKN